MIRRPLYLIVPYLLGALAGLCVAQTPATEVDVQRFNAVKDSKDTAQLERAAGEMGRADLAGILRDRVQALRSLTIEWRKRADNAYDREDWTFALAMYKQLADYGDKWGMFRLGFMYDSGRGVPRDDAQAVLWFRKAAEAGEPNAMEDLGFIYANGRGLPQDDAQAVLWYRKAGEAGMPGAMTNLGFMYGDGKGVPQDNADALAWFRKGAEAGNTMAMFDLGVMYENGRGTTADRSQAVEWYRKAAKGGYDSAKAALRRLGVGP